MNTPALLVVDGAVERPLRLTFDDLAAIAPAHQIEDVRRFDPKRTGGAVRLASLLELARPKPEVRYLTLHATADDFHASIPLAEVRERGLLIYRLGNQPLPVGTGGPVRFFIPDHAACHAHEIDECANVKFVDRIELSRDKGFDNRPHDEAQHAALHRQPAQ